MTWRVHRTIDAMADTEPTLRAIGRLYETPAHAHATRRREWLLVALLIAATPAILYACFAVVGPAAWHLISAIGRWMGTSA